MELLEFVQSLEERDVKSGEDLYPLVQGNIYKVEAVAKLIGANKLEQAAMTYAESSGQELAQARTIVARMAGAAAILKQDGRISPEIVQRAYENAVLTGTKLSTQLCIERGIDELIDGDIVTTETSSADLTMLAEKEFVPSLYNPEHAETYFQ